MQQTEEQRAQDACPHDALAVCAHAREEALQDEAARHELLEEADGDAVDDREEELPGPVAHGEEAVGRDVVVQVEDGDCRGDRDGPPQTAPRPLPGLRRDVEQADAAEDAAEHDREERAAELRSEVLAEHGRIAGVQADDLAHDEQRQAREGGEELAPALLGLDRRLLDGSGLRVDGLLGHRLGSVRLRSISLRSVRLRSVRLGSLGGLGNLRRLGRVLRLVRLLVIHHPLFRTRDTPLPVYPWSAGCYSVSRTVSWRVSATSRLPLRQRISSIIDFSSAWSAMPTS